LYIVWHSLAKVDKQINWGDYYAPICVTGCNANPAISGMPHWLTNIALCELLHLVKHDKRASASKSTQRVNRSTVGLKVEN